MYTLSVVYSLSVKIRKTEISLLRFNILYCKGYTSKNKKAQAYSNVLKQPAAQLLFH